MKARRLSACLSLSVLCLAAASPAFGLANRVFVSARSGSNLNSCDNVNSPCQTFAGAVTQLNPDGALIVLDSGGYGPVTITQGMTIEAPAGVTAFIHPPSGNAITINAGAAAVTLRGLTLNGQGTQYHGIVVGAVGVLNVENCFITGFFPAAGILMGSPGNLNVRGTVIKECEYGVQVKNDVGVVRVSLDHCHLDGNFQGYQASSTDPGSSTTTATYTTANGNAWGYTTGGTGRVVVNLEFCTGSENGTDGLDAGSSNVQSVVRYSNCVFANNGAYGVARFGPGTVESRGNNTITGNGNAPTFGTIGSFPPQ